MVVAANNIVGAERAAGSGHRNQPRTGGARPALRRRNRVQLTHQGGGSQVTEETNQVIGQPGEALREAQVFIQAGAKGIHALRGVLDLLGVGVIQPHLGGLLRPLRLKDFVLLVDDVVLGRHTRRFHLPQLRVFLGGAVLRLE